MAFGEELLLIDRSSTTVYIEWSRLLALQHLLRVVGGELSSLFYRYVQHSRRGMSHVQMEISSSLGEEVQQNHSRRVPSASVLWSWIMEPEFGKRSTLDAGQVWL